jgi:chromate reductase, NAD(P)H dehydrogenase (quinone)
VTISDQSREPVSFLVFSAALRAESLNSGLARLAVEAIEAQGGSVDHATMRDFDVPSYDSDCERCRAFRPALRSCGGAWRLRTRS